MKVCFVCLYGYPLFQPAVNHEFGGSEVRAWLFARELAKRPNYDVSFVVYDHGQPAVQRWDNVTVYAHNAYHAKLTLRNRLRRRLAESLGRKPHFPWVFLKRFSPSLLWLLPTYVLYKLGDICRALFARWAIVDQVKLNRANWKVYREIDADIYCGLGVTWLAAEAIAFCLHYDKRFVLLAASDMDFSESYQLGSRELNLWQMPCGTGHLVLKRAHRIAVQTERQAEMLKQRFDRDAVLIRNPIPIDEIPRGERHWPQHPTALWIGKSDNVKRPQVCMELAKRCPDVQFVMVMNLSQPDVHQSVLGSKPDNVQIIEKLPFQETYALFDRATVLVNTSLAEGFPYAFLQAGVCGVPLLSLNVDPDGFITNFDCGVVAAGDMNKLAEGLNLIVSQRGRATEFSQNVRQYVLRHHALDESAKRLDQLLQSVSRSREPSATEYVTSEVTSG